MEPDPRGWDDVRGGAARWVGEPTYGAMTAAARTDWFIDPVTSTVTASAPVLATPVEGDVQLSVRVEVLLQSTFDAAALFVHGDDVTWAKLALERSPDGEDLVVTVVTRGVSDDANGPPVAVPGRAWLRVSRVGEVYAFHHSADGLRWSLARLFTLGPVEGHRIGVSVQSPLGDGLTARFRDLRLVRGTLADPRDGS